MTYVNDDKILLHLGLIMTMSFFIGHTVFLSIYYLRLLYM